MISKTIGSAGDYPSLSAAEASIPDSDANDYTFTYIESFADTTAVTFSAASFTGSVYVTVDAPYRNNRVDVTTGAHIKGVTITFSAMQNVHIEYLGVLADTVQTALLVSSASATNLYLDKMLVVCTVNPTTPVANVIFFQNAAATGVKIENCFFVDSTAASTLCQPITGNSGTLAVWNVSILRVAANGFRGLRAVSTIVIDARNVKVVGPFATSCFAATGGGAFAASSDGLLSTDTTASTYAATTAYNSVSASSVMKSVADGSEDLHWPDRATMQTYPGISISGGPTIDIDGTQRAGDFLGADFVPANDRFVSPGAGQFLTVGGNQFVVA